MRHWLPRFLGRLSVGRKLLLIFLLDMSAVAYISSILVHEKYLAIDFARSELAGSAYIAALRPALMVGAAAARQSHPPSAELLAEVARAEQASGAGLGTDPLNRDFQKALQALAQQPDDVWWAHTALDRGHELIRRIGNQSNLILDPDLDSYYAMSLVVLRVPELLDALAGVTGHLRGPQSQNGQARFLLLDGRLDTSFHALKADYDEAFAAGRPEFRAALQASRDSLYAAVESYRKTARAAARAPWGSAAEDAAGAAAGPPQAHRQVVSEAELVASHEQLMQSLAVAWTRQGEALDDLLHVRIEAAFSRMAVHLGTAMGLLALILTAVFYVASQISRPLRSLADVTDRVRLTGDHGLRAKWQSSDEIGRLVLGFNDMLAQLDGQREAQQELAARARGAQAQQEMVEAMPIAMMVTSVPGHQVLHANAPARVWLGGCVEDPWRLGLEAPVRMRFFQRLADREAVDEFEVHWQVGPEPTWAVLSARQLEFQGQSAVLTTFTPVTHLKHMERRLELWAKVFEASSEGIVIIDAQHRILTTNRAYCRSTGHELHELIGAPWQGIGDSQGGSGFLASLWPLLTDRTHWQGEVTLFRRNGSSQPALLMLSVVRDAQLATISHYIATTIDISDRKRNEERIRFLAQHDVLTELPNRSLCIERLRMALQQAQRRGDKVAVLFIDLDRFKNINDTLGHHVGDGLLLSVARRLQEVVRAGDTVSRLGGDEFVVVLNGCGSVEEVASIVEHRLVPRVREPHWVEGSELHVSCSVGIALYPDDSEDLDTLMRHADVAMYQAKALGRDGAHFFTADLNDRAQLRMKLENKLRHAIERREFHLLYQPRVDADSGRVLGVEALLRWECDELGSVMPTQFIPIAEDTRLIVPIGAWVIDEACRQMAEWRALGQDIPQVSVNVSALQLDDDGLLDTLRAALDRHALPPSFLELELTESTLMDKAEQTLERLHAIKRLGIELAVDDFGTGYSSLNYLNRFPIDRLKIDRSFVRDMFEDPTDLAITRAIINLGHTLGLKVVAEGVETERESQTLLTSGCDELQGYLFSRPVGAAALEGWMRARERLIA